MNLHRIACAAAVLAFGALGCGSSDESNTPSTQAAARPEKVTVTMLTGETIQVDSSKICWNTATPIPRGYKAVPDVEHNRLRFVPESSSTKGVNGYMEIIDDSGGGGGITCTCTSGSGGCSPGKVGDTAACVMTTCSTCTKS